MRLQVGNEIQQAKNKDLNDKFDVTIFTTSIRGCKAFSAKQKISELNSRIAKTNAISEKNKAKIPLTTIIKQSAQNMNNVKSKKYGLNPNGNEKKTLSSERFKTLINIERIKRSKKISDRLDKHDQKNAKRKTKKKKAKKKRLRGELNVDEKVLILAERMRKKSASGKFYKQTVQNISYFNKENMFTI